MSRKLLCLLVLLSFAAGLAADTVILKSGERLDGKVLSETADSLLIEVEVRAGRMGHETVRRSLLREEIASIRYEDLSRVHEDLTIPRDPDYNSLMFCPTPATLEKGDFYFRNFELYILNFGWGVSEFTSLSFMTHFPIFSLFDFGSVGIKQRILDREKYPIGVALAGSYTFLTDEVDRGLFTGSLILGLGDKERSLNLALNQTSQKDNDPEFTFVLGGDWRASRRTKFLVEYMNATDFLFDDDEDFNGFLNLGVRFFGNDWSFSFTGIRPMMDTDNFVFWPMIMFSYHAE